MNIKYVPPTSIDKILACKYKSELIQKEKKLSLSLLWSKCKKQFTFKWWFK